jgi:hypothetical protein
MARAPITHGPSAGRRRASPAAALDRRYTLVRPAASVNRAVPSCCRPRACEGGGARCNHTALHVTAEHGVIELTRVLLDAGADPDIRDDKYGATVLGWAEYCGHPQIAELLRQRGATT